MKDTTVPGDQTPGLDTVGLNWTGRLANGIAHDLANLLMIVSARTRFALSVLPPDSEARAHLDEAAAAARDAATLVRHLARSDLGHAWRPQLIELNGLIAGLDPVLGTLFRKRVVVRVTSTARECVAYLDGTRLERTVLDLAFAHLEAVSRGVVSEGGVFEIATKTRELDDRIATAFGSGRAVPHTLITVVCNAASGAADLLDGVLRHWATSDEQPTIAWRDGVSACAGLPHGAGYLLVENADGQFRVSVYVSPVSVPQAPQAPSRPRNYERPSRTVMVTEDQISIRRLITRSLNGRGYAVLDAGDGASALALAEVHGLPIDVLVTDMDLPGMNGLEISNALRARHPQLLTVFMSGSNAELIAGLDPREAAVFLVKPFEVSALVQIVAALLDRGSA